MHELLAFFNLPQMTLATASTSQNKMPKFAFLLEIQRKLQKNKKLYDFLKKSNSFNMIYNKFLTADSKKVLSAEDRHELAQIFKHDVANLEDLLGIKTNWQDFK